MEKLVLNLGLRYDINLPPTGLNDSWSDFSPTTPNPTAGGIPGAVLFAGTGTGRVGSRTLANLWTGGIGPHLAAAYSWDSKTVIRASYARSFGSLVSVSGSTHNSGFTLTQTFSNSTSGILPTYTMDQGMPPWTAPPFINPSVSNGTSVAWFQGNETTKLPSYDNFHLSVQRQLGSSMVAEISYNGVLGSHLQTQLLEYNQINPKYLTAFGTVAQSVTVLNSLVGSATANAAGVFAPYPAFNAQLGLARYRGAGASTVPAIHRYRYVRGPGRPQRPLDVPCDDRDVFQALDARPDRAGILRVFEDPDRLRQRVGRGICGGLFQPRPGEVDRSSMT